MGTEHPLYYEKFAAAVRKPLDGSAVLARKTSNAHNAPVFGLHSVEGGKSQQ